ncbi:MAG: hypothetical protein ACFCU8_06485 [Thermosynechococcaceae cyanobacterium]
MHHFWEYNYARGTLPWLLRHEWRLWCRDPKGLPLVVDGAKLTLVLIPIFCVGIIAVELFCSDLQDFRQYLAQYPATGLGIAIATWGLLFLVMLRVCFDRLFALLEKPTDLDLVASSPLGAQHFFMMQFGKLTTTVLLSNDALPTCAPLIIFVTHSVQPVIGLAITLILQALLCSSLAMWMWLDPVRWLGLKRAFLFTKSLYTVLVLLLFLGLFATWLMSLGVEFQNPLWKFWQQSVVGSSWWSHESWLWFPTRTLLLDPQAVLLMTLLSVGLFGFSAWRLPMAFIKAVQKPPVQRRRSAKQRQRQFMQGEIANIILKEWRILLRSPQIWAMPIIVGGACIPVLFLDQFRIESDSLMISAVAFIAWVVLFLGLFLTVRLTRTCLAQDQSLSWLPSTPITSLKLHISKLLAVLLLVWGICIPIGVVLSCLNGPGVPMIMAIIPATTSQAILAIGVLTPLVQLFNACLLWVGLSRHSPI